MTDRNIKRNLLGSMEIALFMPFIEKRFGSSYDEALRSFYVPLFMFPFAMLLLHAFSPLNLAQPFDNSLVMLYSLRYAGAVGMFLAIVYFIAINIDRKEHFFQFVIAYNWVAVPSTVILLPVLAMVYSGAYSTEQLVPFLTCIIIYSYMFTAFIAQRILRLPWELGMFVAFLSMMVNNGTFELLDWVSQLT